MLNAGLLLSCVLLHGAPADARMGILNGWFVHGDRVVWGYAQHNGWWGGFRGGNGFWTAYKVRANITRRAPDEVGPCRTEDLDRLTDNMVRYGYPGFEHNFGLWYDRRRDAHDAGPRADPPLPPFLEQPWARSGQGRAWDGGTRYDLTRYNPWYFERLREFAALCERKGALLLFNFYMQHALLETEAHYVDFPWRPANCLQETGMPDRLPAANAFYDLSHPTRRALHRAYIRHCLDELGGFSSVVFLCSQEYTGPVDFMAFWLDTIHLWEEENGRRVRVALGAPRDALDALLADPVRNRRVDVLDLRYWWYRAEGTPFAPPAGREVAGRYAAGFQAAQEAPPEQIHRQVREYRDRYPGKAILHSLDASREQTWAFLMAGGALLIRRMEYADRPGPRPWLPPEDYQAPPDSAIIQPTCDFIREHLGTRLPQMTPRDLAGRAWCLAQPERTYLVYSMGGEAFQLDLSAASGSFRARWFDPCTGELRAVPAAVRAGSALSFQPPSGRDWALWLERE